MSYTYRLNPIAREEYAKAYALYEDQMEGLGEQFIETVEAKIKKIVDQPDLYGSKSKGYRETITGKNFPYQIVYKIYPRKKEIYISSIYHQKRDPRKKYRK